MVTTSLSSNPGLLTVVVETPQEDLPYLSSFVASPFHQAQTKDSSPSPSHPSKPAVGAGPSKRKKRRRNRVGCKKKQGFGGGSSKRDSDSTDDAGSSPSISSDFSDSEVDTKQEGVEKYAPFRLRSTGAPEVAVGVKESRKRKKPDSYNPGLPSSSKVEQPSCEATPLPKRWRVASPPITGAEFKTDPSFLSPEPVLSSLSPDRPKKKKRIPFTLVEASKGNRCPTEGCDGHGHITGLYAMHFAVSGCPKAHGKTAEECKARREELNRLRSKNMPVHEKEESGGAVGVVLGERSLRRTQRSSLDDIVSGRGNVGSLSVSRKLQSQVRLCALYRNGVL